MGLCISFGSKCLNSYILHKSSNSGIVEQDYLKFRLTLAVQLVGTWRKSQGGRPRTFENRKLLRLDSTQSHLPQYVSYKRDCIVCCKVCQKKALSRSQYSEDVSYLQWVSTDRAKLVTITESKGDFIDNFSSQVVKLTRHSFTAKAQSSYMKELKATMKPLDNVILQGDFAENFQDEVQSFHWENKQATLHPFVAYHRLADGTLEHSNICE